jgi:hypothetical protein
MLQFFEMLPFKEPETSQACCFHSEAFVTAPAHNSKWQNTKKSSD